MAAKRLASLVAWSYL